MGVAAVGVAVEGDAAAVFARLRGDLPDAVEGIAVAEEDLHILRHRHMGDGPAAGKVAVSPHRLEGEVGVEREQVVDLPRAVPQMEEEAGLTAVLVHDAAEGAEVAVGV